MPTPDSSYREIPLTQGKVALVDAADYAWLTQWKWHAYYSPGKRSFYVGRLIPSEIGPRQFPLKMHREILGLKRGDARVGDHINGNGLDNRRSNLRIATPQQNQCNRGKQRNNTTGFKGVYYNKKCDKFAAAIRANKKLHYLGLFSTAEGAHAAYCAAADRLHGDFAKTI